MTGVLSHGGYQRVGARQRAETRCVVEGKVVEPESERLKTTQIGDGVASLTGRVGDPAEQFTMSDNGRIEEDLSRGGFTQPSRDKRCTVLEHGSEKLLVHCKSMRGSPRVGTQSQKFAPVDGGDHTTIDVALEVDTGSGDGETKVVILGHDGYLPTVDEQGLRRDRSDMTTLGDVDRYAVVPAPECEVGQQPSDLIIGPAEDGSIVGVEQTRRVGVRVE